MLLFLSSNSSRWRAAAAALVLVLWAAGVRAYEDSPVYWQENGAVTVEEAAPPPNRAQIRHPTPRCQQKENPPANPNPARR